MDFHAGLPGRLRTFTLSTSRSGGDIPSPVATLESVFMLLLLGLQEEAARQMVRS